MTGEGQKRKKITEKKLTGKKLTGKKLQQYMICALLAVCCLLNTAAAAEETGIATEAESGLGTETVMAAEDRLETETCAETEAGSEAGTTETEKEDTATEAEPETAATEAGTETAAEETETETETESPIDFKSLWKINRDIYAWVSIPGTVINYPVLHSVGEDDFYLYHDIEGNKDIYGSIYTQQVNSMDFSDFHTILYGHNMRDDTMFGWLSEYQNLEVLWNHGVIYIYLPDRTLEYWIFAAYVADNLHQLGGVDTLSRESRQEYLDKIEERCRNIETFDRRLFSKVTADSHILTLSTCYQNEAEHRFLVQAVLIEQPDPGTLPEMEGPRNRPAPEETETETEEIAPGETAPEETDTGAEESEAEETDMGTGESETEDNPAGNAF